MSNLVKSVDELAATVNDGVILAVPPDYSGCAMAAVRALIRRGVRELHLLGLPQIGFQGDMLIGAGCVKTLETAALTLGEFGPAPRFVAAVKSGALNMRDSTCPAIHAGLQAAEKGIPFMPLRGILDSDVLSHRSDWKTMNNPFDDGDPLVVLPAIRPDVTLFHAALADQQGNVWIGVRRELMLAAHASTRTLVTVEEVTDANLLEDERFAPGTIPSLYISGIATAPKGAWPVGLAGRYAPDAAHLAEYVKRAQTDAGFAAYLDDYVVKSEVHVRVQV